MTPRSEALTDGQDDPNGTFRLEVLDNGDIEVHLDGQPQYRIEPRPRVLADFEPTCWRQQTHPASHFRSRPTCSRLTESGGFITVAGRQLIVTDASGVRTETTLTSDAQVLAAYAEHFDVHLTRMPVPVNG
jgi:N-hydroxyarylamine O-acetyltransferase